VVHRARAATHTIQSLLTSSLHHTVSLVNPSSTRDALAALTGSLVLYRNEPAIFEAAIRCFLDGSQDSLLFVVDNSEKPLTSVLFQHPRVRYAFAGRNLGFGAGHNLALSLIDQLDGRPAQGHLFLNPDVTFGPSTLPTLLAELTMDPHIGAVMPQVLFSDGQLQRLCKLLPTPADLLLRRFLPIQAWVDALNHRYELFDLPQVGRQDVPSLSGCFLLVRSSLLKQIGGFDERYFMYMEDVDLVRRIGDHARTVYIPSVAITHGYSKGSYLNPKLLRYHLRSARTYFNKWGWLLDPARSQRNRQTLQRLRDAPAANQHVEGLAAATPAGPRIGAHLRVAVAAGSGTALTQHGQSLLLALRDAGCRPVMIGPRDEQTEQLIDQGFDFIEVPAQTSLANPLLALTRAWALRRVLKAGCFDAAFTFSTPSNILFGLAARGLKLPHVPTVVRADAGDLPELARAGATGGTLALPLRQLHSWSLRWARCVILQGGGDGGRSDWVQGGLLGAARALHLPSAAADMHAVVAAYHQLATTLAAEARQRHAA
jgi:GT2 family glycosyltransferase